MESPCRESLPLPPQLNSLSLPISGRWNGSESGQKRLFIGGVWVDSRAGNTLESVNPATEQPLAQFASADGVDVDAAVVAARRAFEAASWSGLTPHQRTHALLRIAETIDRHADELAAIESFDVGMPLWLSTAQASGTAETFRYYAGWPSKIFGTTIPKDSSALMYTLREPLGVCGQIVAWNTPLAMAASKIANALACGNTVVLKPAELTPLSALRLGELIQETDLPPGVVNIVPGPGATAGAAIAAHPGVDKVAFVGSTAVGRQIVQASAGNLKRLMLELGGKSPNIIFPDADVEKAVQAAVRSICFNSGQHCAAGTRLLVHASLHQDVAREVAKLAATYKIGSPFAPDTNWARSSRANNWTECYPISMRAELREPNSSSGARVWAPSAISSSRQSSAASPTI